MQKGLDNNFINYGIRREDLRTVEQIATDLGLDYDWIKEELLKVYHEKKLNSEIDEKTMEKLLDKALNKLKTQ